MVQRIVLPLLPLLLAVGSFAQTATFAWTGSTDNSQGVHITEVDGVATFYSGDWNGSLQITNGYDLSLLTLPQPGVCSLSGLFTPPCAGGITMSFLPNQSYLDCWTIITWDPTKYWGTRPDGTTMDGTKAGDFYGLNGATVCPLWNGVADINLSKTHTFENLRVCVQHAGRWCTKYATELLDVYTGGVGVASGTCTLDCSK